MLRYGCPKTIDKNKGWYHLKEWPADKAAMIPPIMTHMANPYLYMSHDQLAEYLPPEAMAGLRSLE